MRLKVDKEATLLKYLEDNLDVSRKKIKEYLKYGSIYVDGVKTTKYDYPLRQGDIININTFKKNSAVLPFPIIYEDKNIIVVDKPANLLTIASLKEKEDTVYHMVSKYLKSTNPHQKVFIVHRLDKDTSGVLLLAKSEKIKDLYQKDWNKFAKRSYVAIVHGKPKKEKARLVHSLKETTTNLVYIAKGGKDAITSYMVEKTTDNYSRLLVDIETGRKNQIRVQLASIGCPIVGDKKYGIDDKEKRLFLHAHTLTVYNSLLKKEFTYVAQLPKIFEQKVK